MTRTSTRRRFIKSGGATITGIATLGAAGTVAADHMDEPGENVSLEYDVATLEKYRPRLVFPTEARDKLIGLYGWVARSPDFDTDVCCYWCRYTHQQGWVGPDSHFGDTEPVQIEINSETGEVEHIRASVYHWLKGEVTPDIAPMYDDTHVKLRVIEPWHQYTAAGPADEGVFVDVEDLTEAFPRFLDNGLEEALAVGSTTVPWRMRNRTHWWRNTSSLLGVPFSTDAMMVKLLRNIGVDTEGTLEATA